MNSQAYAKRRAIGGKINSIIMRLKPHNVINEAKGTMNMFANTVTKEIILK
jgi:hypothetical protein